MAATKPCSEAAEKSWIVARRMRPGAPSATSTAPGSTRCAPRAAFARRRGLGSRGRQGPHAPARPGSRERRPDRPVGALGRGRAGEKREGRVKRPSSFMPRMICAACRTWRHLHHDAGGDVARHHRPDRRGGSCDQRQPAAAKRPLEAGSIPDWGIEPCVSPSAKYLYLKGRSITAAFRNGPPSSRGWFNAASLQRSLSFPPKSELLASLLHGVAEEP